MIFIDNDEFNLPVKCTYRTSITAMIAPLVSDMGVDGHDGEYYVVLEVTQLEEGGAGGPQVSTENLSFTCEQCGGAVPNMSPIWRRYRYKNNNN